MTYQQLVTPNTHPKEILSQGKPIPSWAGWCIAYVQVCFGTPRYYESATQAWNATRKKHGDRNFPVGVYFPIWFSHWGTYGTPARYGNWGHVVIAKVNPDGTMQIWSSPASDKRAPDTYSSIKQIETIYSSTFVGWTEDLSGVTLIQEDDMQIEAALNALNQAAHGKPMTEEILKEKVNYLQTGGNWNQLVKDLFEFSPWFRSLPRILDDVYAGAGVPLDEKKKEEQGYALGEGRLELPSLLKDVFATSSGTLDKETAEKAQKFDQFKTLFRGLMD